MNGPKPTNRVLPLFLAVVLAWGCISGVVFVYQCVTEVVTKVTMLMQQADRDQP